MKNIRKLRVKNNISTKSATNILGISHSMLYKIETGQRSPSKEVIKKMSLLYKCSVDEIFKALEI